MKTSIRRFQTIVMLSSKHAAMYCKASLIVFDRVNGTIKFKL